MKELQSEEEKLARAKRQLLIVGVVCVAVIIFTLWAVALSGTFHRNRRNYHSPLDAFRSGQGQVGGDWKAFETQLQEMRKNYAP